MDADTLRCLNCGRSYGALPQPMKGQVEEELGRNPMQCVSCGFRLSLGRHQYRPSAVPAREPGLAVKILAIPLAILVFLGGVAIIVGPITYLVVTEMRDPGPDEGDICANAGEVKYDEEGNELVCR